MNKHLWLIMLLIICGKINAQNLVPNPSFEQYDTCPNNITEFDGKVKDWTSFRNVPEYYNACDIGGRAGVPKNCGGYQQPASGNAYAGIDIIFGLEAGGYREYIGVPLISALNIGTRYYVTFKVSPTFLDTTCTSAGTVVINNLGAFFTTIAYSYPGHNMPTPNYAQVYDSSIISDTANWTTIKGSFIADSAYTYVVIGDFFNDSLTSSFVMNPSGSYTGAYYYIDDVCVSPDSLTCNSPSDGTGVNNLKNEEELILFPNPFTDDIRIDLKRNESVELYLYDITGREILKKSFTISTSINTEQLGKGVYLYELRNKSGVIKNGKVVKE